MFKWFWTIFSLGATDVFYALEQRLTIVLISLDTVSSFKFPQGPIYFKPLWGGGGLFTTKIMTPILHRELEYKVCVGHAAEACE